MSSSERRFLMGLVAVIVVTSFFIAARQSSPHSFLGRILNVQAGNPPNWQGHPSAGDIEKRKKGFKKGPVKKEPVSTLTLGFDYSVDLFGIDFTYTSSPAPTDQSSYLPTFVGEGWQMSSDLAFIPYLTSGPNVRPYQPGDAMPLPRSPLNPGQIPATQGPGSGGSRTPPPTEEKKSESSDETKQESRASQTSNALAQVATPQGLAYPSSDVLAGDTFINFSNTNPNGVARPQNATNPGIYVKSITDLTLSPFGGVASIQDATVRDESGSQILFDQLDQSARRFSDPMVFYASRITDANGRVTTLSYDTLTGGGLRLNELRRPNGFVSFSYGSDGYLDRLTDEAGREARFEHDSFGNVTKIILPEGGEIRFRYDEDGQLPANHFITSVAAGDRPSHVKNHYIAQSGKVASQEEGGTISFPNGTVVKTGGTGYFKQETFSATSQPELRTLYVGADGHAEFIAFDKASGNELRHDSFAGFLDVHNPAVIADLLNPNVPISRFASPAGLDQNYLGFLSPTHMNDPAVLRLSYAYDTKNRMTTVTGPDATVRRYTYPVSTDLFQAGHAIKQTLDFGGALEDRTSYMVFHPVCGVAIKTVDARGTSPTYAPQNGSLPGVSQADRYSNWEVTLALQEGSPSNDVSKWEIDTAVPSGYPAGFTVPAFFNQGEVNGDSAMQSFCLPIATHATARVLDKSANPAAGNPVFGTEVESNTIAYNAFGTPKWTRDSAGNVTNYEYNAERNPTDANDSGSGDLTKGSDGGGYPRLVTFPDHGTAQMFYDDAGNVTKLINPRGFSSVATYDDESRIVQSKDAKGAKTDYTYDKYGDLISVTTDIIEAKTDSNLMPTGGETVACRSTEMYRYDILGNIAEVESPITGCGEPLVTGTTKLYSDPEDPFDVVATVSPEGVLGWKIKDEFGRTAVSGGGTPPASFYTRSGMNTPPLSGNPALTWSVHSDYDALGNLSRFVDQLGKESTFVYNAAGLLVDSTDPTGTSLHRTYDPIGNVLSERVDAGGKTFAKTETKYDELGRAYAYRTGGNLPGDGWSDSFVSYGPFGPVAAWSDTGEGITTSYDAMGRVKQAIDSLGNQSEYTYDLNGNQIRRVTRQVDEVTGAPTDLTAFTFYDKLGRAVAATGEANLSAATDLRTSYAFYGTYGPELVSDAVTSRPPISLASLDQSNEFGPLGITLTGLTTNEPGNTTIVDYGQTVTQTSPLRVGGTAPNSFTNKITTKVVYDRDGRVVKSIDAANHETNTTYDELGRPTATTYPDGTTSGVTYNAAGEVVTSTDANGTFAEFTYDDAGRITHEKLKLAPGVLGPSDMTWAYDGAGRLIEATTRDSAGVLSNVTQSYDMLGNVIRETVSGRGLQARTFNYDFANNGDLAKMTYPGGRVLTYGYDAIDRLQTITDPAFNTPLASYDYRGRDTLLGTQFKNGTGVTNVLSPLGDLTKLRQTNGAQLLEEITYTPDRAGRIAAENSSLGVTRQYQYDSVGRLTNASRNGGASAYSANYLLNGVGNRTGVTGTGFALPSVGTYDSSNVMDAAANRYTHTPSGSQTYDKNGNMITKTETGGAVWHYSYDASNQLASVTGPGTNATYLYDSFGRRIAETLNGVTTAIDVCGTDQCGRKIGSGPTQTFVFGPGIDNPIEGRDATGANTYFQDIHGVRRLTNDAGAGTTLYNFDEFGNILP